MIASMKLMILLQTLLTELMMKSRNKQKQFKNNNKTFETDSDNSFRNTPRSSINIDNTR